MICRLDEPDNIVVALKSLVSNFALNAPSSDMSIHSRCIDPLAQQVLEKVFVGLCSPGRKVDQRQFFSSRSEAAGHFFHSVCILIVAIAVAVAIAIIVVV